MNECVFGSIEDTTKLNHVYHTNRLYHSDEFETLLERSETDLADNAELESILEFISVQCGDWFTLWVCSPANQPDIDAQAEFDNWELLWRAFVQSWFKDSPERLEVVTRRHIRERDVRLLRHVEYLNESKSSKGISTRCLYWTSRSLRFIGMNRVASRVLTAAIYPKGSVGRG